MMIMTANVLNFDTIIRIGEDRLHRGIIEIDEQLATRRDVLGEPSDELHSPFLRIAGGYGSSSGAVAGRHQLSAF